MNTLTTKPKRGRPPKNHDAGVDVKRLLIRSGVEMFTEKGYMTSDINGILKKVGVPKGSFYYYFESKEQFGLEIMHSYDNYFSHLLDKCLCDPELPPLARIEKFYQSAKAGMEKYNWLRGCLVGNLGQEVANLPDGYGEILNTIISGWQKKVEICLSEAQAMNTIPAGTDCRLMAAFFWMGWEGAVMRAKLTRNSDPLDLFISVFINKIIK
ncbi:TetR/AcrR family transcriptional regulator [Morganella psychrotolerans]|uniref:TetR family transcriptional regulator n=1 Tax=Morganella psychrotolerans TaxID=368603 RepID=A0A1B8HS27_9GAMM|nr:TetR/AcrR family transcriptional regulator [Morganella psychrotolerans]OBU12228.1 TetR family transcriptional regulator [Morganella psychrotolerans]